MENPRASGKPLEAFILLVVEVPMVVLEVQVVRVLVPLEDLEEDPVEEEDPVVGGDSQ